MIKGHEGRTSKYPLTRLLFYKGNLELLHIPLQRLVEFQSEVSYQFFFKLSKEYNGLYM